MKKIVLLLIVGLGASFAWSHGDDYGKKKKKAVSDNSEVLFAQNDYSDITGKLSLDDESASSWRGGGRGWGGGGRGWGHRGGWGRGGWGRGGWGRGWGRGWGWGGYGGWG